MHEQQRPSSMLLHNTVNCVGIGLDSTWRALALQVAAVVVLGMLCIWPMVHAVTLLTNIMSKEQMALPGMSCCKSLMLNKGDKVCQEIICFNQHIFVESCNIPLAVLVEGTLQKPWPQ